MISRVPAPDGRKKDGEILKVLPEGTVLNFVYEVSYITAGGMSVVYKGVKGEETFCIKEVESGELQKVFSLSQEKAMLERLSHPGIVQVVDCFDENGFLYLVLEYIEGKNLCSYINQNNTGFIEETLLEKWAFELYDIFEYLHSQKPPIIYRDLKPQNVMCRADGSLCLVDFGIARVHKGKKNADTYSMGTDITASPEHYGGKETDIRSDIFTIGATLHYLVTNGKGTGKGFFEFIPIRKVNPSYSEKLEKIINKAVEILPEDRFQSVSEMRIAHTGDKKKSTKAGIQSLWNVKHAASVRKMAGQGKHVPYKTLIAAVIIIVFLLSAVFMLFFRNMLFLRNSGKKIPFYGCFLTLPYGYFPDKEKDFMIKFHKKNDTKNIELIAQIVPLNQIPESRAEIEKMLFGIVGEYQNKYFHNEVTYFNRGNIIITPQGYSLQHSSFNALDSSEKNPDIKQFITHDVNVLIHDKRAYLLAAQADSGSYSVFSDEFNSFFSSITIEKK